MIVRHRIFEKYENYSFHISYKSGDRVLVNRGDNIKQGTDLIRKTESSIKYSFYIPEKIGVGIPQISQYINCIDGELVNKGDVLAQKVVSGGLHIKKLISPAQGVVDLSRLSSGYLDLLGEENEVVVSRNFNGTVEEINPIDGINILASSYALDILAISDSNISKDSDRKLIGQFTTLGEGKDLLLEASEDNYQDKIVFVGKYLHTNLLHDLFEKGALFVLTYSMDYEDFRKQGLPVGVVGGFGEMYSSKEIIERISSMDKKLVVVDYEESQLFFVTDDTKYDANKDIFVKSAVGSTIISRSLSNYGMLGKVVSMEDEQYITVEWDGGQRSMVNLASVEFVSF
jgi:hypothetical protein